MPETITREMAQQFSKETFEKLSSNDPMMIKEGADAVNDFTRLKMREDEFYGRVIPEIPLTNDELDRSVEDDKPIKIVDRETNSPAAITMPFGTLPMNYYIRGQRYKVTMARLTTPRFTTDVDTLRTYYMDIRQVLSDNAIKDMLAESDGKFLRSVNTALLGAGLTMPSSGVAQYEEISGGITRDTLVDGLKIMPNTPSCLEAHVILLNNITSKEVSKFTHNEAGGTISQDIMFDGKAVTKLWNRELIITIKKGLVATNALYHFADPKFIGKNFVLEPPTMYVKREAYFLEFFTYMCRGGALGHLGGISRADYV